MFDNILHQNATRLLSQDILNSRMPNSILFAGPASSGKLSAALETARVLSCTGEKKGHWECQCASCIKNRAMNNPNLLILGNSNRILEIAASKSAFLKQVLGNSSHVRSTQFLFIRSVRKLTTRFSSVLWEGEDKLSKFSPLIEAIEEELEKIDPTRNLPETEELKEILDSIEANTLKLQKSFLYASVPVSQIRNFSTWARTSVSEGKKVLIIENADLMQESARNSLLKILEEPPQDCIFILTTTNRGAILPTVLSRVRTYDFTSRMASNEQEVISRVFHYFPPVGEEMPSTIQDFLNGYLSVSPETVRFNGAKFWNDIANGKVPDIAKLSSACKDFEVDSIFDIFLKAIIECQRSLVFSSNGSECSAKVVREIQNCRNNFSTYNQKPQACLETLARNLMQINYMNGSVFKETVNE